MTQTTIENQPRPQPRQRRIDQPLNEQRRMNIVHIQLAWWGIAFSIIGIGIAFISIGFAFPSLRDVILGGALLITIGIFMVIFSRNIAKVIFDWELNRLRNNPNINRRRLTVMPRFERLVRVAVWILFILGILDFLAVLIYTIAAIFSAWNLNLSVSNIVASSILGLIFLILSYIAANIRERE
jgi:hypothetical protein